MTELNKRESKYLEDTCPERYTLTRFLTYLALKSDAERRERKKKEKESK